MAPFIILMILLALGAIAGHLMGRYARPVWLWLMWALLLGALVVLFLQGRAAEDHFDGLGAAIFFFLFVGPFLIGSLITGGIALWRRSRGSETPSDPDPDA